MKQPAMGNQADRHHLHAPLEIGGTVFRASEIAQMPTFLSYADSARPWLWATYFPFLLAYSDSPARAVMLGEHGGSLFVLLHRTVRGHSHIDFLLPPLGSDYEGALENLAGSIARINGSTETRFLWADLPGAAYGARRGWAVTPYEHEYLYERRALIELRGNEFRALRKKIHRCEREVQPEFRAFVESDVPGCEALLREWQDVHRQDPVPVFDFGYTLSAIRSAARFQPPHLVGVAADVGAKVRAFAFGGMIREGLGQFFVLKSDPACKGLAEATRLVLVERMEGCDLVNDAGDLSKPGLAQHKRLFRPVSFVPTFKMACRSAS